MTSTEIRDEAIQALRNIVRMPNVPGNIAAAEILLRIAHEMRAEEDKVDKVLAK